MKKIIKKCSVILGIITLLSLFLIKPLGILAKDIPIDGLDGTSATVTDGEGNNVTGQTLNKYKNYKVSYQWSIPNGTDIQPGDTATITIPNNVSVPANYVNIPLKDASGNVIGTFDIKQGATTGTITFNDYLSKNPMINIHGDLSFTATGTEENTDNSGNTGPRNPINKSTWIDRENDLPWWNIAYNIDQQSLTNVVIRDELHGDQAYKRPIIVQYGHYENGQFIVEREESDPNYVTIDGKTMTVNVGNTDKVVQVRYQTEPTNYIPGEGLYLENIAYGSSTELGESSDMASQKLSASGDVTGERPSSSSEESSSESSSSTTSEDFTSTESTTSMPIESDSTTSADSSTDVASTSEDFTSTESTTSMPIESDSTTSADSSTDVASTSEDFTSTESTTSIPIESDSTTSADSSNHIDTTDLTSEMTSETNSDSSKTTDSQSQKDNKVSMILNSSSKNDNSSQSDTDQLSLPKTGNNRIQAIVLTLIGILILIIIGIYIVKRKH